MPGKTERSLEELYQDDRERADAVVFGRRTGLDRRGFLGGTGLAAMGLAVGGSIPFAEYMPAGLIPAALIPAAMAQTPSPSAAPKGPQYLNFPGKADKLVVLGDRPLRTGVLFYAGALGDSLWLANADFNRGFNIGLAGPLNVAPRGSLSRR